MPDIRRYYPMRYWLLVAYAIGVPGFTKFDPTGKTHEFGLFNPQSIIQIALTLLCAFAITTLTLTANKAIHQRDIRFKYPFWLLLITIMLAASLANPRNNAILSLYRVFEWFVFYSLFASAYSRERVENNLTFLRDIIMKVVQGSTALVFIALAVYPSLAYASTEDVTGSIDIRLGGFVIHPNTLGVLAGIGLVHSILFDRGLKRAALVMFYGTVSLLTVSRGAWIGLVVAFGVYFVASPSRTAKILAVIGTFTVILSTLLFSQRIIAVMERGQGSRGLVTFSERTFVWATAYRAFRMRPLIGYGYVDGVRRILADLFPLRYWTPPHCHSELLQALVSGGILCGMLVLLLYGWTVIRLIRLTVRHPKSRNVSFFLLVYVQVVAFAFDGPVLTRPLEQIGCVFILCFVACFDAIPTRQSPDEELTWTSGDLLEVRG